MLPKSETHRYSLKTEMKHESTEREKSRAASSGTHGTSSNPTKMGASSGIHRPGMAQISWFQIWQRCPMIPRCMNQCLIRSRRPLKRSLRSSRNLLKKETDYGEHSRRQSSMRTNRTAAWHLDRRDEATLWGKKSLEKNNNTVHWQVT